jgi:flagellar hook-basal body complex protein FliE
MGDMEIRNISREISTGDTGLKRSGSKSEGGFDAVIEEALKKVSEIQKDVEYAVKELANGGDITSAILAIEKADMSFQLMVEIRNKLINTYEQIMRMQV